MGQRLNIEIMKGCKVLANAYYHWSAYTSSALDLCKIIIENVKELRPDVSQTCDTETYNDRLKFHQELNGEKARVEKITMKGQYTAEDSDTLLAVRLLESTGAGIGEAELKRMRNEKKCPGITVRTAIDRNAGLIAVTEEGMDETRDWQEGQVTIDLDEKQIFFSVFWTSPLEEYLSDFEIDPDEEPDRVPVKNESGLDVEIFAFEDIEKVIALVQETLSSGIVDDNGTVSFWIA